MIAPLSRAAMGVTLFAMAPTAQAGALPVARLVRCDAGTCVQLRGERRSPASLVVINDHVVAARGGRNWKVRVPVAMVRAWSAPFARTLRVAVVEPGGAAEREGEVRLPVGLLGHNTELAALVVHAR